MDTILVIRTLPSTLLPKECGRSPGKAARVLGNASRTAKGGWRSCATRAVGDWMSCARDADLWGRWGGCTTFGSTLPTRG
jgi:hypothetical protein